MLEIQSRGSLRIQGDALGNRDVRGVHLSGGIQVTIRKIVVQRQGITHVQKAITVIIDVGARIPANSTLDFAVEQIYLN